MLFAASIGGALGLSTTVTNAQSVPVSPAVPGRALLDFPLGTVGEVPALATAAGGGLFNPAAILAGAPPRLRVSVAQLNAAHDRDVDGQIVTLAARWGRSALGIDVARMGVSALDRTGDTDPQSLGSVPYDAYLASLIGAHRFGGPFAGHLTLGAAARLRVARADTVTASSGALDVGAVADGLLGRRDVRLAVASYLWTPGREAVERPGLHLGADARVAGANDAHEARLGVGRDLTRDGTAETGVYATGRWGFAEARAGVARSSGFGSHETLTRLALGVRSARLAVGVGREDSDTGFGGMWQFTLSTQLK
jgi:hypothetical protein